MEFNEDTFSHCPYEDGYDYFITDKWKKQRHFKISTFLGPVGLMVFAVEVLKTKDSEPYEFELLFPFDTDIDFAESKIKEKIKRGINKRYLENVNGFLSIGENNEMAGRIIENNDLNSSDFNTALVVDGKKISLEDFYRLLNPYAGWQFSFKIKDRSEEL